MSYLNAQFRRAARDRLDRLEALLCSLEDGTADDEAHRSLQREIHTLKGEANMLGFERTRRFAELVEELIHLLGVVDSPGADTLRLAFEGLELIEDVVRGLDGDGDEAPVSDREFAACVSVLVERSATAERPRQAREVLPSEHSRTSSRTEMQEVPHDDAHVPGARLDELLRLVAGLERSRSARVASSARLTALCAAVEQVRRTLTAVAHGAGCEAGSDLRTALAACDAIDDGLRGASREMKDAAIDEAASAESLRATVQGIASIRAADALAGYPRLFRRAARETGKDVLLRVECEPITVERRIMSSLAEPLVHLLTNAIDHGVESPQDRAAAGKPSVATVTLAARLVGSRMQISVSDDGAGIAMPALARRALDKGLLDEATAASMSAADALRLLTKAGFTTRTEPSKLSGRGIGLDVVRSRVEALGGKLSLHTAVGQGSSFVLEVPTSSTLARVVLVECCGHLFALPVHSVAAIVDPAGLAIERAGSGAIVRLDGAPTLLRPLHEVLRVGTNAAPDTARVIVVISEASRRAFFVGAAADVQTVVVRPVEKLLEGMPMVRSLVTTADGRVAPLLDPAALISEARRAPLPGQRATKRDTTILVVDDSEIARQLTARHLVRAGFSVVEAMDGRAAMIEIARHLPDAIVTDLEMPVMDGFQLLRAVRSAPTFSHVPIVVLSSLTTENHRTRAGELGADAYLAKEMVDQASLCETLSTLLGAGVVRAPGVGAT